MSDNTAPGELEGDYVFKTEFDNLNKEILDNSNKIYQIIQISFTSVPVFLAGVLALGKGDGEGSWWFVSITSLLVFAIIIPSVLLVTSSLNSTVRISQYLRMTYFSGELKGWQYYIQFFRAKEQIFRAKEQTKKYRFFGESLTWIFAGLSLLTILVSLLSFLVYISNAKVVSGASELSWFRILIYVFSILIYVVALLSCVFLLMYSIIGLKRSWSTEAFNDYHDRWKSIDTDISIGITLDQVLEQVSSLKKCEENNQMRA